MTVRVLHVVTYMGRGGLETMIMNYYRHIDREKVQFDFLVHRDFESDYDHEIEELGGKIYRLPNLNPFSKAYLNGLDAFFAEHKEYKIVHSHLDCMAGIPLKYAKKHGVPIRIAHAHSSSQTKDVKYLLKLFFKTNIKRYATWLFACGNEAGRWMFRSKDFYVLNNAVDVKRYMFDADTAMAVRREIGIDGATLVVGHVGRFMIPKNHRFLIEIFSELHKRNSDTALLLVGDGELKDEIACRAEELGVRDRVIFAGVRSDVHRMLQAMDVFVFPSLYEGLPLSLIEAQAAGLPCVISDKVPDECKKTDLVQSVTLDSPVEIWADYIARVAKAPRRNTYEDIVAAGFDIVENAAWLENFYLEQYRSL